MKKLLLALGLALLSLHGWAADEPDSKAAELQKTLSEIHPLTGDVSLKGGLATFKVPEGLQFLNAKDAQTVLVKLWGNPPQSADDVLGMIVVSPKAAVQDDGWGIIVTYTEDGHVDDADAAKTDYTKLLKQMQKSTVEANKERVKNGYSPVELVGWAEPPHYDADARKIYWAKELSFGRDEHTLNYCTRILGRRGVLELNAVSSIKALPEIRQESQKVLAQVDFNPGNRYADFDKSSDKMATYGVAALVAGGVAAKAGFFKVLIAGLLAAKKLVIVSVIAAWAFIKKFFTGKSAQDQ